MQRGSGGMQDGGQGAGSSHMREEKKCFLKKQAAQSASPASHPSLSLSIHLSVLSQAESVMICCAAGCGSA